jgi:hypothetical protein
MNENNQLPADKYNLRNLRLQFGEHKPSAIADPLVRIADQVCESVLSWREGCLALAARTRISLDSAYAFLSVFCGQGKIPDYAAVTRAVECHVDGVLELSALYALIQMEYGFDVDMTQLWTKYLVEYERHHRQSVLEEARRSLSNNNEQP